MRISDWSSDVCSSDLLVAAIQIRAPRELQSIGYHTTGDRRRDLGVLELLLAVRQRRRSFAHLCFESGNALGVGDAARSEERRVGTEGVSPCRSRWSPDTQKTNLHSTRRSVPPSSANYTRT